jgi:signal transduction histidine kinase/CheY-like chemotaxis protein
MKRTSRPRTSDPASRLEESLRESEENVRRLEAQLHRTQNILESLQSILPQLPVPVLMVCSDKTIAYANPAARALFTTQVIDGRSYPDVLYGRAESPAHCPLRMALDGVSAEKGRITLADGTLRVCAVQPVHLADGRSGALAVITGVDEITRSVEETDVQRERLFALGELISGIAHELNNPLTGVIGFSELLSQKDFDPKTTAMVGKILKEANRCKRIVASLLSFSRKHPYERSPVDVRSLIQQVLELHRSSLRAANIRIVNRTESALPSTAGDPSLLQQVLFNVINNAQHAMAGQENGTLTIETSHDDDRICVRITDTGPGVPRHLQERIFEPFFTTKPGKQGTGLGLSISSKIIQRHGGTLRVESDEGKGASFIITLPVVVVPLHERRDLAAKRKTTAKHAHGHFLVVDDEQAILDVVTTILETEHHRVTTTLKASDALRALSRGPYDCIISDIGMPGLDGHEFLELLKAMRPDMVDRLIFITGDYFGDSTAHFIGAAGVPCVRKPFSQGEILEVANEVLSRPIHARSHLSSPEDIGDV